MEELGLKMPKRGNLEHETHNEEYPNTGGDKLGLKMKRYKEIHKGERGGYQKIRDR